MLPCIPFSLKVAHRTIRYSKNTLYFTEYRPLEYTEYSYPQYLLRTLVIFTIAQYFSWDYALVCLALPIPNTLYLPTLTIH